MQHVCTACAVHVAMRNELQSRPQHASAIMAVVHHNMWKCYQSPSITCIKSTQESCSKVLMLAWHLQVAVVRSPSKLEQEQTFLVAKKLQELTGSKNIKMKPVIDESLIAGFIIEYGSSQIDMSVKGQLDKISQELENASFAF